MASRRSPSALKTSAATIHDHPATAPHARTASTKAPSTAIPVATRAIETVGLKGFEHHYPKSLSGGMRMRCSLARTLTLNPPLFLFDEPFGAVDEITREHLNEETQQLFLRERFAGLFITHSISEAVFLEALAVAGSRA